MVEEKEVVVVELDRDDDDVEEDEEVKRLVESNKEVVKWENLLPKMVVRVLLVEADDSTRQIIAALLRKCNYKVAAISDGLKAWEILKRKHSSIDLILTELDLPSISGYALLTLIMEDNDCKNIPVIVMSSQDSISMVLKCMLKGATDFLIKPVRKNELKNLWRHVWKRLATNVHNPQNITMEPCKVEETSEDHATINLSSDNVSFSQKNSKVIEGVADAQNSSHVNDWEEGGLSEKGKQFLKNIKLEELDTDVSDSGQATKLATGVHPCNETNTSATLRTSEDESCTGIATEDDDYRPKPNSDIDGHEFPEPSDEAKDLIGGINKQRCTVGQSGFSEGLDRHFTSPQLELSLRRSVDPEPTKVDERHVLNHSSASAFSWYGNNKRPRAIYPLPEGDLMDIDGALDGSRWPQAFNVIEENKQSLPAVPSGHDPQAGHACEPGLDVESALWTSHGSTIRPKFRPVTGLRTRSPTCAFQREESPFRRSASIHSESGTHSGCDPLGGTVKNSFEQSMHEVRESVDQHCPKSSFVDQSGGSVVCDDFVAQPKSSAHGSMSEVNDVNPTRSDMMGTSSVEQSSLKDNDQNRVPSRVGLHTAEREAALAKFRLKRKGRCFEKKVRYQSRKKLAEQRPRVKGQFVRQAPKDQMLSDTDKQ